MAGYKKKGPSRKAKKQRKKAPSLSSHMITRGHKARMRRFVLPI